ncbi:MAG: hypothetical protein JWP74_3846 [Marmoricola sp.]|nr:hypothetical protein [Marmoricola sp.]
MPPSAKTIVELRAVYVALADRQRFTIGARVLSISWMIAAGWHRSSLHVEDTQRKTPLAQPQLHNEGKLRNQPTKGDELGMTPYRQRPACTLIGVLAVALLASGCSSSGGDSTAWERAAHEFAAAIQDQDGRTACDLLSSATRTELTSSGQACETAVLETGISAPGQRTATQHFGTAAQVTFDDDVYFLGTFSGHWYVTAAACSPVTKAPYDCDISGG